MKITPDDDSKYGSAVDSDDILREAQALSAAYVQRERKAIERALAPSVAGFEDDADAPSIAGIVETAPAVDAPSVAGFEEDADARFLSVKRSIDSPRESSEISPTPIRTGRATGMTWPRPTKRSPYTARVFTHLFKFSLRAMNRARDEGKLDALREAWPEWLQGYAWEKAKKYFWHPDDGPRSKTLKLSTITPDELRDQVRNAIARAYEEWDPTYIDRVREMSAAGGRNSTHGARFTPDMLEGLKGLTHAQQAARIGCSERTIYNVLKRQRRDAEKG